MTDISKKTLEKIKREQLHPRPRWVFLTRNYFFWLMFALTTLLGGLAFGMILFLIGDLDWDIYHYLNLGLPEAVLISIPYLWIALMLFFLFTTYYNFIHTRTGYRYRFVVILFISLVISVLLGLGFYHYGWTEAVENHLRKRFPGYHRLVYSGEKQWMHPEKGLLSGTVTAISPENNRLWVEDHRGQRWEIDISQAAIRGNIPLSENLKIKLIGQRLSEDIFEATEIRLSRGFQQGKGRR